MITEVHIENFRGIAKGDLSPLTMLTVLVGPNGCGKTTVLEGIYLATADRSTDPVNRLAQLEIRQAFQGDDRLWFADEAFITVQMADEGTKRLACLFPNEYPNPDEVIRKRYGDWTPLGHSSLGGNVVRRMYQGDTTYGISLSVPSKRQGIPELAERVSAARMAGHGSALNGFVRDCVVDAEGVEVMSVNRQPIVGVTFPTSSVPLPLVGEGVRGVIQLAVDLLAKPGTTILIEEPEAHLHPRAARLAARIVWRAVVSGVQVILTTHSIEFIDDLLAELPDGQDDKLSVFGLLLKDGVLRNSRYAGRDVRDARERLGMDLR